MLEADAIHTSRLLASAGITSETWPNMEAVCRAVRRGAGAVLLAEETLVPASAKLLLGCIEEQPAWSDLPIVVSVIERDLIGAGYGLVASLGQRVNVTLLERPVNARAMIRAVQSALRARRRQYEARNLVEALGRARDLAEANSRARDEFLATLSHELRTPLNAILGWTRMLRRGTLDAEKRERALATVERSAVAQTQLVEDLLDVSRAAAGKLRLSIASVDPADVVKSALDAVRPTAQAKSIELSCSTAGHGRPIAADRARLEQVMWNLLSNAIKFTPKGGRIRVAIEYTAWEVEIAVTDDGIGIASEFMPHLFERFRQADATMTRAYGGLGIGLSIVKSVVELHGGTVTASSDGKDRGSTFVVHIPAGSADAAAPSAMATNAAAHSPSPASSVLSGLQVLVVDDAAESAELPQRAAGGGGSDGRDCGLRRGGLPEARCGPSRCPGVRHRHAGRGRLPVHRARALARPGAHSGARRHGLCARRGPQPGAARGVRHACRETVRASCSSSISWPRSPSSSESRTRKGSDPRGAPAPG